LFTVRVGFTTTGGNWTVTDFFPNNITIEEGDSIFFVMNSSEPHTVTFAPPSASWPLTTGPNFIYNQPYFQMGDLVIALNNITYSSGLLVNPGDSYQVSFPNEGTFHYRCIIHGNMVGVVEVSEDPAPLTPAEILVEAQGQVNNVTSQFPGLEQAQDLLATTAPSLSLGDGRTLWSIRNGGGSSALKAVFARFVPGTLTIKEGDVVEFVAGGFVHTVNFNTSGIFNDDPILVGGQLAENPLYVIAQGNASDYVAGFISSGLMGPVPGFKKTYNVTFYGGPGIYPFECNLHDELGMIGFITISAAARLETSFYWGVRNLLRSVFATDL